MGLNSDVRLSCGGAVKHALFDSEIPCPPFLGPIFELAETTTTDRVPV